MLAGGDGTLCRKWGNGTCLKVKERARNVEVRSYDSYRCTTQWLVSHEMNIFFLVEVEKLMLR